MSLLTYNLILIKAVGCFYQYMARKVKQMVLNWWYCLKNRWDILLLNPSLLSHQGFSSQLVLYEILLICIHLNFPLYVTEQQVALIKLLSAEPQNFLSLSVLPQASFWHALITYLFTWTFDSRVSYFILRRKNLKFILTLCYYLYSRIPPPLFLFGTPRWLVESADTSPLLVDRGHV